MKIKNSAATHCLALILLLIYCPLAEAGSYSWPLDEPTHLTGTFGEYRDSHLHNGIDFSVLGQRGRPVMAVASGEIDEIFYKPQTYGLTVIISHDDGRRSWYAHLDSVAGFIKNNLEKLPRPGVTINPDSAVRVEEGEVIGQVGDTGRGPVHLHFTLEDEYGNFINPLGHFNPPLPFNPRPRLGKVYLYPLDGKSWVNGRARPVALEEDKVTLRGNVGVEIQTWNSHPGTANRTLPWKVVLEVDGQPVKQLTFDSIPISLYEKPVTTVFNREFSNLSPTRYYLDLTPEAENPGEGIEFNSPGDTGTLKFSIYPSVDGSPLEREFTYRVEQLRAAAVRADELSIAPIETAAAGGREDFSEFLSQQERDTGASFDYRWLEGRVELELQLPRPRGGQPVVEILHEEEKVGLKELLPVEPGRFKGWWVPEDHGEGWHELQVVMGNDLVAESRLYLQMLQFGRQRVVVDSSGRYSVYTSGEGLNYEGPVNFEEIENYSHPREGLEIVESPRILYPRRVQATSPMMFEVTMVREVDSPENVMLFGWNPTAGRWEILPEQSSLTARHRSAEIYSFKKIALLRDNRKT